MRLPLNPPHDCHILIIAWPYRLHPYRPRSDVVWGSLMAECPEVRNSNRLVAYIDDFHRFAPELTAYRSLVKEQDYPVYTQPNILARSSRSYQLGGYVSFKLNSQEIVVFHPFIRLYDSGPSFVVEEMLKGALEYFDPNYVITAGIGGGVRSDQIAGDVVVTRASKHQGRGFFRNHRNYNEVMKSEWSIPVSSITDVSLERKKAPDLLPPSPNYQNIRIEPNDRAPTVYVSDQPVTTSIRMGRRFVPWAYSDVRIDEYPEYGFALQKPADNPSSIAVDMDCASVGNACIGNYRFVHAIGLTSPAINNFGRDFDYQSQIRQAWLDTFIEEHGKQAANNCATVVRHLIQELT